MPDWGTLAIVSLSGKVYMKCGLTPEKGYRIYYARQGKVTYFLINGGDKHSQQQDINEAIKLWLEYQRGESA
ncbi:addiction module killer protein [Aggregatibacter actinomycetemcomitans]|uniref:addiction module killer protein n=1 Tax=Aggregatibacter actinomycetemcomitans TaxID=714 RepID=UPI001F2D9166|nr:addiction module killer protein [Aggregatibacter actinomycetemcomitans]